MSIIRTTHYNNKTEACLLLIYNSRTMCFSKLINWDFIFIYSMNYPFLATFALHIKKRIYTPCLNNLFINIQSVLLITWYINIPVLFILITLCDDKISDPMSIRASSEY